VACIVDILSSMTTTTTKGSMADEKSRVGAYRTAREMALSSHNLSRDGMVAVTRDGGTWKWSEHFNVWACVEVR